MKKRAEMLQKVNALRKQVVNLLAESKFEEAKTTSNELEMAMDELEKLPAENTAKGELKVDKKSAIRKAVNAFVRRGWKGMSDEERGVVKVLNATATPGQVETVSTRGGVLVPVETADFVATMDAGVYRLRDLVFNYFVRTLSGKMPVSDNETDELEDFDELPEGEIPETQKALRSVDWQVKDKGIIVPVSNDLEKDAISDPFEILANAFQQKMRNTENKMILAAIDAAVVGKDVTDWKGIVEALNTAAPIGGTDKKIITNPDGWNYLDTLTDEMGRPLLTQALVDNPRAYFRGYEVIQLPYTQIATTDGKIPFYVGKFRDAVVFVERQGVEISYNPYSDKAFRRNATDVRVVARLDAKSMFADAVKKVLLPKA